MKKLLVVLLSSPSLFASMVSVLVMVNYANAAEPVAKSTSRMSCVRNPHGMNLLCERVATRVNVSNTAIAQTVKAEQQSDNKDRMLAFTEQESDEAIARFGCDCQVCINALRQLRGLQPVT